MNEYSVPAGPLAGSGGPRIKRASAFTCPAGIPSPPSPGASQPRRSCCKFSFPPEAASSADFRSSKLLPRQSLRDFPGSLAKPVPAGCRACLGQLVSVTVTACPLAGERQVRASPTDPWIQTPSLEHLPHRLAGRRLPPGGGGRSRAGRRLRVPGPRPLPSRAGGAARDRAAPRAACAEQTVVLRQRAAPPACFPAGGPTLLSTSGGGVQLRPGANGPRWGLQVRVPKRG